MLEEMHIAEQQRSEDVKNMNSKLGKENEPDNRSYLEKTHDE